MLLRGSEVARWVPSTPVVLFVLGVVLGWLGISLVHLSFTLLGIWLIHSRMGRRLGELQRREARAALEAEKERARREGFDSLSERERVLIEELDSRVWLDDVQKKIYKKYAVELNGWLKSVLDDVLEGLTPLGPIMELGFTKFDLGPPLRVRRVVATRLENDDEAQLDVDVEKSGPVDIELAARLGGDRIGITIPLSLQSISLEATLRVRARMTERPPFVGVLDVALAREPTTFDFALHALLELSGLPAVADMILDAVKQTVMDVMLWPKKITIPLDEWWHPLTVPPRVAHGVLRVTIDRATDLPGADLDGYSDPYVVVEVLEEAAETVVRETFKTTVKSKQLHPVWDDASEAFFIMDPANEKLSFKVMDYDKFGDNDLLGTASVPPDVLRNLSSFGRGKTGNAKTRGGGGGERTRALWLQIAAPKSQKALDKLKYQHADRPSRLRVELSYGILAPRNTDFKPLDLVLQPKTGEETVLQDLDKAPPPLSSSKKVDAPPPPKVDAPLSSKVDAPLSSKVSFREEQEEGRAEEKKQDTDEDESLQHDFGDFDFDDDDEESPGGEDLDAETLRRLCRYGQVTLRAGRVRKQSKSGFGLWKPRYLELQLTLEYKEAEAVIAATLVHYRVSSEKGLRKKNVNDDEGPDDRRQPLGELRLCAEAELLKRENLASSLFPIYVNDTQFEVKAKERIWRFRCESKEDASSWTATMTRAIRAIRTDHAKVADLMRRASLKPEAHEATAGASLVVELIEARGLAGSDDNGLSDPYAVAAVGPKQTHTTRIIKQTLSPEWNEYVEFWAGTFGGGHLAAATASSSAGPPHEHDEDAAAGGQTRRISSSGSMGSPPSYSSTTRDGGSTTRERSRKPCVDGGSFGGFDLRDEKLTVRVWDDDLGRRGGQPELLGSLDIPLEDLLPEEREHDHLGWEGDKKPFAEPPAPKWWPLRPPTSSRRHRRNRHDPLYRSLSGGPAPAGEILLRLTLRRFHVARLDPPQRRSQPARVLRAVADQVSVIAKGVQGVAAEGANAVANAIPKRKKSRRTFKAAAHAVGFSRSRSRSRPP